MPESKYRRNSDSTLHRAYEAGFEAARRLNGTGAPGKVTTVPCPDCGAADARDAAHAAGCPTVLPLSRAELLQIAMIVERGWAEAARRSQTQKAAHA